MDRSALRITVVVALWLATITIGSFSLAGSFVPVGHGSFDMNDLTVTAVVPGGAADRAGIRVGDRFVAQSLYAIRRTYDPITFYKPAPGTRIHVTMLRAGRPYRTALTLASLPNLDNTFAQVSYIIGWVFSVIALSIAAWLLLACPSAMTWSFFAFSLSGSALGGDVLSPYGYEVVLGSEVWVYLLVAMSVFFIRFAVRAPNNTVTGWRCWVDRCVPVLWLAIATVNLYPLLMWEFSGKVVVVPSALHFLDLNSAPWFIPTISISLMLVTFLRLHGIDRQRMKWILFGTAVWACPSLLDAVLSATVFSGTPYYKLFFYNQVLSLIRTSGIAVIAYGVVRSRVVDVAFFISRGVVLAVLASATVIVFGVLDYIFVRRLEDARLGAIAEIIAAIAIGFWFQGLHRRVDSTVDRLLFRGRHKAEQRLARAARAIVHADDASLIRDLLVVEAADALNLASAALFELADTGVWQRTTAMGWTHCEVKELTNANPLVLYLQSEHERLRTSTVRGATEMMPSGNAHPVLALPILAQHRLVAIALYGMHNSGADLDADDLRSLESLANAAGTAFAHVDAQHLRVTGDALRVRVRELEIEAAVLRRQIANLASVSSVSTSAEARR